MKSARLIARDLSIKTEAHLKIAKGLAGDSILRGFTWASILLASVTLPLVLISIFYPTSEFGQDSTNQATQAGILTAVQAGGSKVNWIETTGANTFDMSGSVKITLITVLLQLSALRYGRKLARGFDFPIYIPTAITAAMFATTLYLASLFTREFEGVISGPKSSDWLRMFLCVAIPMALGSILRRYQSNLNVDGFKATLRSTKIYSVLLTITALVGAIAFTLVEWLRPDFINSQPHVSNPLPNNFYWYLLAALLGILLNLPAIIILVLATLSGVSLVASFYSTIEMPGFVSSLINSVCDYANLSCEATTNTISGRLNLLTFVNEFSTPKRTVLILVFLVAIGLLMAISSSFGSNLSSSTERFAKRTLRYVITFSIVGGYLVWLVNGEFSMTQQATDKLQINLDHGNGTIGLAVGTAIALLLIFALVASLTTHKNAKHGFSVAFPRLAKLFRATSEETLNVSVGWKVFGILTTTTVILTLLLPTAGAMYERFYAVKNGPAKFAKPVQTALETANVKKFVSLTGNPKDHPWMKTAIMEKALPKSTTPAFLNMTNRNAKEYKTGQLDPVITYTLGNSDEAVKYPLTLTGTTRSLFEFKWNANADIDYLTAADFKYDARPVQITIKSGRFVPSALIKRLTINGIAAKVGTYNSVPGTYRVKLPGYKMIAPTDITLTTASTTGSVTAGGTAEVPSKMNAAMTRKYNATLKNKCKMKPENTSFNYTCASDYIIWQNRKIVSGQEMTTYDSWSISKVKASPLACDEGKNRLLSASTVSRVYRCTSTVTFKMTQVKDAVYEQGDPIYRDVPQYENREVDTCPSMPYWCYETRRVYIGTTQEFAGYARGPLISPAERSTTQFTSTVPTSIVIKAVLGNKGKFTVSGG